MMELIRSKENWAIRCGRSFIAWGRRGEPVAYQDPFSATWVVTTGEELREGEWIEKLYERYLEVLNSFEYKSFYILDGDFNVKQSIRI